MTEKIIVSNQEDLEKKKKRILEAGAGNFHVVADFDRTLTKAFVDGKKSSTVIAQIRNGNYLSSDYVSRAHALFDYYHPIEIDPNVSDEEKNAKMHEWWQKHFDLLIECGLDKKTMQEIVAKREIKFRKGALEFIDFLHEQSIPLVIMSAAPGDMLVEYLRQEGRLYDDVSVVANLYDFDESGKATRIREPIIHSMNKAEIAIKGFPVFEKIRNRKNVLLLGDSLGDTGMIEGFDYDNLIGVGYLNENVEENLSRFKKDYDVVLLGDGDMSFVSDLVREFS
jgi:cytosolic 5'-nucleotidase 3